MAEVLSDHYTATVGGATIDDPRLKVDPGIAHAKVFYKRATVTAPAAITTADVLRFFPMKTGDRLHALYISTPSFTGTGQPASCGFYKTDLGAVVDADAVNAETAPLDDLTVAIDRVDMIGPDASQWNDERRGMQIFAVVDAILGTSVYDNDPQELWDVCLTMGTENGVTVGAEIVVEAYYTSAGS